VPAPTHRLGVAFVPVKGEKPELVVQKLTEIGIDDIYPLAPTAYSVVKWEADRAEKHHVRLAKVAREAAMQSRRVWLPEVHRVQMLANLMADHAVAFAEPGGAPLDASHHLVVVGPEGGFSHEELHGAPATVSLGESVLRAETAAIVAGTLMVSLRRG
jgi:16S rRNA (uracil1498-N3)-methyltransferase